MTENEFFLQAITGIFTINDSKDCEEWIALMKEKQYLSNVKMAPSTQKRFDKDKKQQYTSNHITYYFNIEKAFSIRIFCLNIYEGRWIKLGWETHGQNNPGYGEITITL